MNGIYEKLNHTKFMIKLILMSQLVSMAIVMTGIYMRMEVKIFYRQTLLTCIETYDRYCHKNAKNFALNMFTMLPIFFRYLCRVEELRQSCKIVLEVKTGKYSCKLGMCITCYIKRTPFVTRNLLNDWILTIKSIIFNRLY